MEAIWIKNYPAGVPATIDPSEYPSLVHVFDESVKKFAQRPAYHSMGVDLSYQELDEKSLAFAQFLSSIGVRPGDRVALMMPNILQYPVALFGTLRAGAIAVNCNPLYTAPELQQQLKDSGAQTIVILENFANTLIKIIPETAITNVVVTSLGELLGAVKGTIINLVVRHIKKMVPAWELSGHYSFQAALARGAQHQGFNAAAIKAQLSHDSLAFLQYTGGTTGPSKGAMLSHGNMVSNVLQSCAWIGAGGREGGETIITALPLYHIFALTANCLTFMRFGAKNILIANPRDIPGFIKTLAKHQFTIFTGVNTLFNALLNHPDFSKLDFSSLRLTLGGGAAVQQAVADKWLAVTGITLAQAYGLTEASPAVTINPLSKDAVNQSIGLPISSTIVSIRDEAEVEVAQGELGEICVKGPQVMSGYWQREDETRQVFCADGFLKTGDIGYINPQGFVFLVDRKKDMIKVSGFNVYPNQIEEIVAHHPAVLEVAALGVSDPNTGEAVKLFIVRKDPNLTEQMIIDFCRTQMTGYKVPKKIEFRDELPKSNIGKILRRALKEQSV